MDDKKKLIVVFVLVAVDLAHGAKQLLVQPLEHVALHHLRQCAHVAVLVVVLAQRLDPVLSARMEAHALLDNPVEHVF